MSAAEQKRYICTNIARLSFEEKRRLMVVYFVANGLQSLIKEQSDSLTIDLDLVNDDKLIEGIYSYVDEICRRRQE